MIIFNMTFYFTKSGLLSVFLPVRSSLTGDRPVVQIISCCDENVLEQTREDLGFWTTAHDSGLSQTFVQLFSVFSTIATSVWDFAASCFIKAQQHHRDTLLCQSSLTWNSNWCWFILPPWTNQMIAVFTLELSDFTTKFRVLKWWFDLNATVTANFDHFNERNFLL